MASFCVPHVYNVNEARLSAFKCHCLPRIKNLLRKFNIITWRQTLVQITSSQSPVIGRKTINKKSKVF